MAETLLDMAPGVSSVPQSAPQGSGSTDMDAILRSIVTPIDPALIKAASMPIAGSHVAGVPSSLTTPIAPHQNMPFNNSEVVGRHNAKMRGIGNAITGVTNALGTVVNKEAQQKQGQIKDAATKVIMAQQGIDEAKQALEAAHASGDTAGVQKATQLIQQNQQARDAIFADPKMRKALVKGFNISYTDPQSNKTEDHEAVKAAMAQAKTFQEKKEAAQQARQKYNEQQGAGAGAAFEKSAPQGMQPNVQAQQQLAAVQQERKDAIETFKAMGPIYAEQLRAQGNITVESMRSATDLRKAAIDVAAKLDEQILKNKQAGADNAAARSLEAMRNANARSLELLKQGNPIEVLKSFNDAQKNYETSITENQKSRQALNNELDKASSSRALELRRQLQDIDAKDEQAKNAFTLNRNVIAKGLNVSVDDPRLQIPTVHVGEGVQNGASAAGTGAESVSADNDPRTGKPWKSSVSATDRLLIKGYYGAGIISHDASQTVDSINQGVRKVERFFDSDKNNSD
jgi:hypothetical protein